MKKNILSMAILALACIVEISSSCSKAGTETVVTVPGIIYMKNAAFSIPSMVIMRNTTVTWVNNDNITHSVTADDGSFDSGAIQPDSSWRFTFTAIGNHPYHCKYVTSMTGLIAVTGTR
jgi:plastocyanin